MESRRISAAVKASGSRRLCRASTSFLDISGWSRARENDLARISVGNAHNMGAGSLSMKYAAAINSETVLPDCVPKHQ